MRQIAYVVFCTACMIGLWYAVQFLITGVSEDFGRGVLVGSVIGAVIVYLCFYFDQREGRETP